MESRVAREEHLKQIGGVGKGVTNFVENSGSGSDDEFGLKDDNDLN
jgi:hypothetical protein